MRGNVAGSGISLTFTDEDVPVLANGGDLEGKFTDYLEPGITLHVLEEVERKPTDHLCEPGFRIEATPEAPPDKRERYEIWMSIDNARNLVREGYWVSRSPYDRVDMSYISLG